MQVRISKRAIAQVAALGALIGLCVAMTPVRPAQALRLATVAPADRPLQQALLQSAPMRLDPEPVAHASPSAGVTATTPAVPAFAATLNTWNGLRPALRAEAQVLTRCRADSAHCPPAAAKFLAIVEAARAQTGRARLGHINRAVNLAIKPMSDLAQYGVRDVWATPLMTFASGSGDCEDYAIAKYVALREAGMAAADLRLRIVHDTQSDEDHAVVAARLDGEWLVLDNRRMAMLTDTQASGLILLVALGDEAEAPARLSDAQPAPAGPPAEVVFAGELPRVDAD